MIMAMLLSLAMTVEGGGSLLYAAPEQEFLAEDIAGSGAVDEEILSSSEENDDTVEIHESQAEDLKTDNESGTDDHVFFELPDDGLTAPDVDAYMSAERETKGIRIQELTEEDVQGSSADDSYYSSVDKGYVSDVIDQADSQLCWAFSAASCMEFTMCTFSVPA